MKTKAVLEYAVQEPSLFQDAWESLRDASDERYWICLCKEHLSAIPYSAHSTREDSTLDRAASQPQTNLSDVQPKAPSVGLSTQIEKVVIDLWPIRTGEGTFFCPECGSRTQGESGICFIGEPDFFSKEFNLEERRKDPWFGVAQLIYCNDCGTALPAHIAKQWNNLSELEAANEWRNRFRGYPPPI